MKTILSIVLLFMPELEAKGKSNLDAEISCITLQWLNSVHF